MSWHKMDIWSFLDCWEGSRPIQSSMSSTDLITYIWAIYICVCVLMSYSSTGAETPKPISLLPILYKRLHVQGSTLRSRSLEYQAELIDRFRSQVLHGFTELEGDSKPNFDIAIHKVSPSETVQGAHFRFSRFKSWILFWGGRSGHLHWIWAFLMTSIFCRRCSGYTRSRTRMMRWKRIRIAGRLLLNCYKGDVESFTPQLGDLATINAVVCEGKCSLRTWKLVGSN